MTTMTSLPVEERLWQLLQHLGIDKAHFAGWMSQDWIGFVTNYPAAVVSLTLAGPSLIDPPTAGHLASKLLMFSEDRGPMAELAQKAVAGVPDARLVALRDYSILPWTDVAADRTDEIEASMMPFLAQTGSRAEIKSLSPGEGTGEVAGIFYRVRGAGPPLVLMPLFLAPSQWEPLITRLSEQYCTITVSGPELGIAPFLESRGSAVGYVQMVRTLLDEIQLQPGESVLEIGCGTGVITRWLAQRLGEKHRVVGMDINPYLLREATMYARREGLEDTIEFREGNAEALPFLNNSVDVTLSVTVIEEVDATQMLAEMVRVTKPGGRVAVVSRATDMPFLMHLPLSEELKAKVQIPGMIMASVGERGCADASLYQRLYKAGLTKVKMFPQLAPFTEADTHVLPFLQTALLSNLSQEEAHEWQRGYAQAKEEGTFFMAWPHHCAVGTKL